MIASQQTRARSQGQLCNSPGGLPKRVVSFVSFVSVVSLVSVVSWKSLTKPLFYFSLEVFWLQNLIPHHQELDFRNLCPKSSYAYRFNSDSLGTSS